MILYFQIGILLIIDKVSLIKFLLDHLLLLVIIDDLLLIVAGIEHLKRALVYRLLESIDVILLLYGVLVGEIELRVVYYAHLDLFVFFHISHFKLPALILFLLVAFAFALLAASALVLVFLVV